MNLLNIGIAVLLAIGALFIFGITPSDITKDIVAFFERDKKDLQSKIKNVSDKKKHQNKIKQLLHETREILNITERNDQFSSICMLSTVLFIVGFIFAILLNNWFLLPVLSLGLAMIPFWYIKLTSNAYKKELNAELETSLSIITNSYTRNENIINAVEENVGYLQQPVSKYFEEFLMDSKLISSNTTMALNQLKSKVDNVIFQEWCEAVILCQSNRNLKYTLMPIISKFSDIRIVTEDLEQALYDPVKELILMSLMLVSIIPLFYFLNMDWFNILINTIMGKVILAVDVCLVFISINAGVKHSRPIEYKR